MPAIILSGFHGTKSIAYPTKILLFSQFLTLYLTPVFYTYKELVFPTPQQYTFYPGGSVSVSVVAAVPEPQPFSIVGLLSAMSLGILSKRKFKIN